VQINFRSSRGTFKDIIPLGSRPKQCKNVVIENFFREKREIFSEESDGRESQKNFFVDVEVAE
jgi:hypothetical protein